MRLGGHFLLGIVLALGLALTAQAQPGGGRGGFGGQSRIGLLRLEAVQKELGLTEDQIAAIRKLQEETSPPRRGGGEGGERRGRRGRGGNAPRGNDNEARLGGIESYFVQAEQPRRGQISEEDRERFRKQAEERAAKQSEGLAKILKPDQLKRLTEIYVQVAGTAALNDAEVAKQLEISDEQKAKMRKVREESFASMREAFSGDRENREEIRSKLTELRKSTDEKVLAVLSDAQKKKFEEMKGKKFDMPENAGGRRGGRGGDRPQENN